MDYALEHDILLEDGSFHPNADITRAEAASVIVRLVRPMERSFVYQN